MRFACCFSFLCCLLGTVGGAHATGEAERARVLFEQAVEHADAGRIREALAAFQAAYDVAPHFAVLYNVARMQLKLADDIAALHTLESYLEAGGDAVPAERRRWALDTIRRLREVTEPAAVAQATPEQPTEIRIQCPWPDFSVTVDSVEVARTPFSGSLFVARGTRKVTFSRSGYEPSTTSLDTSGEQPLSVDCRPVPEHPVPLAHRAHLKLRVNPGQASALLDGQATPLEAEVPAGHHTLTLRADNYWPTTQAIFLPAGVSRSLHFDLQPIVGAEATPEAKPFPYRLLGVYLGVAGVTSLAAGVGIYLWNDHRYDDWDAENQALQHPEIPKDSAYEQRRNDNNALLESIHRCDTVTWVTAGVGGALTLTGVALMLSHESASESAVTLTPTEAKYRLRW